MNAAAVAKFESASARHRLTSFVAKKPAHKPLGWHPVIRDIIAMMSRDAWEPELEAQLEAGEKVAALKKSERERCTRELSALALKLANAGQPDAAKILASIAVLGEAAEESVFAAQRLLAF